MKMDNEKDKKIAEFYERLKVELDNSNTWPAAYLYKFIVPSVGDNVKQVEKALDNMGAVIKTTQSKTVKFTSVSIDVMMNISDHVISKYKEVSTIEGIVSL